MELSKQERSCAHQYRRWEVPRGGFSSHQDPVPAAGVRCGDAPEQAGSPLAPRAGAAGAVAVPAAVTLGAGTRHEELPLLHESVYGRSRKDAAGPHPTLEMENSPSLSKELQCRVAHGNTVSLGQLQGIMSSDPIIHRSTSPQRAVTPEARLGAQGCGDPCSLPPSFTALGWRPEPRSSSKTGSRWKNA